MKNTTLAQSVRQAHRVETVVETAVGIAIERFKAEGRKGMAAKAGRAVIEKDHMKRRSIATGRFGARVLLDVAGILPLDMHEVMPKVVDHLLQLQHEAELAEIGLNTFLSNAWNMPEFESRLLSAFSYVVDPDAVKKEWVSCTDEETILSGVKAIGQEEWMARGFWDALRWMLENHEGAAVIDNAEFFNLKTLSDLFRIRGQLTWWASFHNKANKLFESAEHRLMTSENEYALSGGTNTHYVGEAQGQWEAAGKRLEKAREASELMADPQVIKFIDDLCCVFELAGKDEPRVDEYSEEKEFQKQLATMETAAENAMEAVRKMVANSIAKGMLG
jgi:hypothetical protein